MGAGGEDDVTGSSLRLWSGQIEKREAGCRARDGGVNFAGFGHDGAEERRSGQRRAGLMARLRRGAAGGRGELGGLGSVRQ